MTEPDRMQVRRQLIKEAVAAMIFGIWFTIVAYAGDFGEGSDIPTKPS